MIEPIFNRKNGNKLHQQMDQTNIITFIKLQVNSTKTDHFKDKGASKFHS